MAISNLKATVVTSILIPLCSEEVHMPQWNKVYRALIIPLKERNLFKHINMNSIVIAWCGIEEESIKLKVNALIRGYVPITNWFLRVIKQFRLMNFNFYFFPCYLVIASNDTCNECIVYRLHFLIKDQSKWTFRLILVSTLNTNTLTATRKGKKCTFNLDLFPDI